MWVILRKIILSEISNAVEILKHATGALLKTEQHGSLLCRSSTRGLGSYREGSENPLEGPSIAAWIKTLLTLKAVTGEIHVTFCHVHFINHGMKQKLRSCKSFAFFLLPGSHCKVRIYWSRRWVERPMVGGSGAGPNLQLSEGHCEGEPGTRESLPATLRGRSVPAPHPLFHKWLTRFTLGSAYSFTSLLSPPFKIPFSSTIRNRT